jgi:hypothetical protein
MQRHPSWLEKLNSQPPPFHPTWRSNRKVDVWKRKLSQVHGRIDYVDRLERVTISELMDILEIPRAQRRVPLYSRLASAMVQLGWTKVNAKRMTAGQPSHQARGFVRQPVR